MNKKGDGHTFWVIIAAIIAVIALIIVFLVFSGGISKVSNFFDTVLTSIKDSVNVGEMFGLPSKEEKDNNIGDEDQQNNKQSGFLRKTFK